MPLLRRLLPLLILVLVACRGGGPPTKVVLVITDDQRWDTLWSMPLLQERLVANGVVFENAFVTTPSCCPLRTSLLSGGYYPTDTGVLDNTPPAGGFLDFVDSDTLPLRLQQQKGWATGIVGKYLNGYFTYGAPYVPPGWNLFAAGRLVGPFVSSLVGISGAQPSTGQAETVFGFGTEVFAARAKTFLDAHVADPFLLILSTHLPHAPATPHPQDALLFSGHEYRDRGWGEEDRSDKPLHIQSIDNFTERIPTEDEFVRNQLRSLQAVDRAVAELYDHLGTLGLLSKTIFIFTSDHGYLWGEHQFYGKFEPYEESIRVPLVVVHPTVAPRTESKLVVMNFDLPATLCQLAGLPTCGEGQSLLPLLGNPATPWRTEFQLQQVGTGRPFSAIRTERYKWIERAGNEFELYDLDLDPYELESEHDDAGYAGVRSDLEGRLVRPLAITQRDEAMPVGVVGQPYQVDIPFWPGQPPYTWSIVAGSLPAGLVLTSNGRIEGTPTAAVTTQAVFVQLEDSSTGAQSGLPRRHVKRLEITVDATP